MTRTVIRIEARTRWDALDLARSLPQCDWYMVAVAPERWDVCIRTGPSRETLVADLLEAARQWASRRDVESVVHLPDGDVALGAEPQHR